MKSILIFALVLWLLLLATNLFLFFALKLNNVLVYRFKLGTIGNLLLFKVKETEFRFGLLPISGYVRPYGMDEKEVKPNTFNSLSLFRRILLTLIMPLSALSIFTVAQVFLNDISLVKFGPLVLFILLVLFCYYFILKLNFSNSSSEGIVYILLSIFQLIIIYVTSLLINDILPIYDMLYDVFVLRERVHFFSQEVSNIDFSLLISLLALNMFVSFMLPLGSNSASMVTKYLHNKITGNEVSEKLERWFLAFLSLILLPIYSFLFYIIFL